MENPAVKDKWSRITIGSRGRERITPGRKIIKTGTMKIRPNIKLMKFASITDKGIISWGNLYWLIRWP